jgi:hypothetical protein
MSLLSVYKSTLSFFLETLFGKGCRYFPTCSEYADEAIRVHGFIKGSRLALKRFLSCHPLGRSGFDPVPKKAQNI